MYKLLISDDLAVAGGTFLQLGDWYRGSVYIYNIIDVGILFILDNKAIMLNKKQLTQFLVRHGR